MNIRSLIIRNFRNHADTTVDFIDSVNLITGRNGSGKTTILEAISVCGITKSFQQVPDNNLVNSEADSYFLQADIDDLRGTDYWVKVVYKDKKKSFSSIKSNSLLPKELIGEVPVVTLNPDDKEITFGVPQRRRSFIDKILSQSHHAYLEESLRLRKIVKQRNNLLSMLKREGKTHTEVLDSLSSMLIRSASAILSRRLLFLKDFVPAFKEFYARISGSGEKVSIQYDSEDFQGGEVADPLSTYNERLGKVGQAEKNRGMTLFGTQRDDLAIFINGNPVRTTASQGQHKSLMIALKLAEFEYLKHTTGVTPVVLLDDIFSELDSIRAARVMELIAGYRAQTFITLTDARAFLHLLPRGLDCRIIYVDKGKISYEAPEN